MYEEKKTIIKSRLKTTIITLLIILSMITIVPQSTMAHPVTGFVYPDGLVTKTTGLTCGEEVTYKVTDDSLDPELDYTLKIDTAGGWVELEYAESTKDGDLYIIFNVPGWKELGEDPISTWNLSLFNETDIDMGAAYDAQIDIDSIYTVRIKYDNNWLDYFIYNSTYTPVYLYVYNWTGSKLELVDDVDFDIGIYQPDGTTILAKQDAITTGIWDLDIVADDLDFRNGIGGLEYYLPVWVDDGFHNTSTEFPVMLAVTAEYPDDAEWGDTLSVTGYVKDGQDNGIGSYNVALYAPVNGGYVQAATTNTYSTGRYSFSVETDYDQYPDGGYSAGTWYIGTWFVGDPARVDESDQFEHSIDLGVEFIRYYWFDVATDDSANVKIESPDEIIDGFEQEINVTVKWNGEPFDIYADDEDSADGAAYVHITGIKAYDPDAKVEIDKEDIYLVGWTEVTDDLKESYCNFNIIFNETGTGTIIVTWPLDGDHYYKDQYNNSDYWPNITGSVDFNVGTAYEMNMFVSNMPDEVLIDESCGWKNESGAQEVTIDIYGDAESDRMNATIYVSGCGLDFTIDEDDKIGDHDNLVDKDDGMYVILINPKMGGVITITATNDTNNISVSKDFSVKGLTGSVTTSIGDDLEISVQTPETITVTVNNGEYATVIIGYYKKDWTEVDCELYELEGDGETTGEGLNGIYEFKLEYEDIEDGVGYIVVVANAAGRWMYEVIEIVPIHDLTIELIESTNASGKDLTVGIDHEDWEFKVYGHGGDVMEDIDRFWGVLIDEDHDEDNPLQTIEFKERSSSRWVPDDDLLPWFDGQMIFTAVNNSGENEHDGNITFNIDCAIVTYIPGEVTAGIDLENFTVEVLVVDANDEPVPDGTKLYLHIENESGNMDFAEDERRVTLDKDGMGKFEICCIGDFKTWINGTLGDNNWDTDHWLQDWEDGNETCGRFNIAWPNFLVVPDTIYIGQANTVTITAKDYKGDPVEGIYLTLFRSFGWDTPDPVETDEDGKVEFSIEPENSGKANVTIARGIEYVYGVLAWDVPPTGESVVTDTFVKITSHKTLKISISKSPIWEDEMLTITITSDNVPVEDVDVEFAGITKKTDDNGMVTFTVPDPGVDSTIYTITAEKVGYVSKEKSVTVIKIYEIQIIGPTKAPVVGEEFTITITAKGAALAGASVEFNGKTYASGSDGKLTITAPDKAGEYMVSAIFGDYKTANITITITEGSFIPGFEFLLFIVAAGCIFILILLNQRKKKRT